MLRRPAASSGGPPDAPRAEPLHPNWVFDDAPSSSDEEAAGVPPVGIPDGERRQGVRAVVMAGVRTKTAGGLTPNDLAFNPKTSRYVSKRVSANKRRDYEGSKLQKWNACVKRARASLGFDDDGEGNKRWVPCGGKTEEGKQLLRTAHAFRRMEGW